MRHRLAVIASIVMMSTLQISPARATPIDPGTVTCGEMVKILSSAPETQAAKDSHARIGVLLIWMAGFLAPESQGSVVDMVQIQTDAEKISAACAEAPNLGVKTVASKFWEKEQPTTSNSIDISTLTCSTLTQKRDTNSAAGLLWLIGNYASDEDTPMFDMTEVGKSIEKISRECAKGPNISITTAAEKVLE